MQYKLSWVLLGRNRNVTNNIKKLQVANLNVKNNEQGSKVTNLEKEESEPSHCVL